MHRKPFSTPPKASLPTRMGPVLSMLLVAVIVALHGAGPSAWANGHAPWPPAPVYELHQKEIPKGTDYDGEHYEKHIEYSLTFEDQAEPVFLARAYTDGESGYSRLGFSEESFKLTWLNYGTLLHATWKTAIQGSGRYVMDSNLLLLKHEDVWREVFRDAHFGYGRNGWMGSDSGEFVFSIDPISKTLIVRNIYSIHENWEGDHHPLAKQHATGIEEHNKGIAVWGKSYQLVREWPCVVADGKIQWKKGTLHLTLYDVFPAAEVREFIGATGNMERAGLEPGIDIAERIRALNPRFGDTGACWGDILLDTAVPPYEPDGGHYYRSGE